MRRIYVGLAALALVMVMAYIALASGKSGSKQEAARAPAASVTNPAIRATASPSAAPPGQPPLMLPLPRGTPLNEQAARDQQVFIDTTRLRWLGQVEEMLALLLVLDGDRSYCGNLCPLTASPAEVIDGLNGHCTRVVLSAIRFQFSNFPEIVSVIDVLDDACNRLKAATDRLGKPVDTAVWRDARAEIIRRIQPVVTAGKAQSSVALTPAGPTPSPLRAASEYYPVGTLTGIAPVDKFLNVLYSGDMTRLADDAVFSDVPCSNAIQGPGAIACPPGTPDGGLVSLLPIGGCSVNYVLTRDQLRERLGGSRNEVLHSVYSEVRYGVYGIAVVTPFQPDALRAYYIDDAGRLVAAISCGGPRGQSPDVKVVFPPRGG